jgi:hypothetical protein
LGGLVEAEARLRPGAGVGAGRHSWIVTCVEAEPRLSQREVLWSWLVTTTVQQPLISSRYEAYGLPQDREKRVKISFENKATKARAFSLHTDQPAILQLPQQRLALSAGASAFIEMIFEPQPFGTLADIAVFINDEDERTDMCIAIRGCWMPPPSVHDAAGKKISTPQAEADAAAAVDKARQAANSASQGAEVDGPVAIAAASEAAAAEASTAATEAAAEPVGAAPVESAEAELAAPDEPGQETTEETPALAPC